MINLLFGRFFRCKEKKSKKMQKDVDLKEGIWYIKWATRKKSKNTKKNIRKKSKKVLTQKRNFGIFNEQLAKKSCRNMSNKKVNKKG